MIPTHGRREDTARRSGLRDLRLHAAVALALASMLLGTAIIAAAEPPVSRSHPQHSNPAAMLDSTPVAPTTVNPPRVPPTTPTTPGAEDFYDMRAAADQDARTPFTRPEIEPRTPDVRTQAKAPPTRLRARGDATWYCLPGVSACHRSYDGGMYAAAGAELRVGDWRGREVVVCRGTDCIRVTLIDWCACEGDRVIDLYGDAYRRLAPLSSGVVRVSVRW